VGSVVAAPCRLRDTDEVAGDTPASTAVSMSKRKGMDARIVGPYFLFFIARVVGGVINAVAGGGGLIALFAQSSSGSVLPYRRITSGSCTARLSYTYAATRREFRSQRGISAHCHLIPKFSIRWEPAAWAKSKPLFVKGV